MNQEATAEVGIFRIVNSRHSVYSTGIMMTAIPTFEIRAPVNLGLSCGPVELEPPPGTLPPEVEPDGGRLYRKGTGLR